MQCYVPFCRNTSENVSTSETRGITFHGFPSEMHLRATWLRALGKRDTLLPDSAVVCSQHFLNDEIYEAENGLKQICTDAVPSTVQVCMICLDTDRKLFLMSKHNLKDVYERFTGVTVCDQGNIKQTLCIQCAQKLVNCSRFRDMSLRTHSLMTDLAEKHELISKQHVKNISHAKNQLTYYNFVSKTLGPDHCDLYIKEPDEDKQTERETVHRDFDKVIVKNKGSVSMSTNEDVEVKNEGNVSMSVNEHVEVKIEVDHYEDNDNDGFEDVEVKNEGNVSLSVNEDVEVKNEGNVSMSVSEDVEVKNEGNVSMSVNEDVEVKNEGNVSMSVNEDVEVKIEVDYYEDNDNTGFDVSNEEYSISDNAVMWVTQPQDAPCKDLQSRPAASTPTGAVQVVRIQDLIKYESPILTCTICFKEFPSEYEYTEHLNSHRQKSDGDRCGTSQVYDPHIVASFTSLEHDNKQTIQKLIRDPLPSIERAHTLVFQTPSNNAEKCKNYRNRKKARDATLKIKKTSLTSAERSKMYRLRKKQLTQGVKSSVNEVLYTASTSNSPMTFEAVPHISTRWTSNENNVCETKSPDEIQKTLRILEINKSEPADEIKSNSNINIHQNIDGLTNCDVKKKNCVIKENKSVTIQKSIKRNMDRTDENLICQASLNEVFISQHTLTANSMLLEHKKTGTDNNTELFTCESCQHKCQNKSHLVLHMRTHTAETLHSCRLCEYKSAHKGNLEMHMRIHNGNKSYTCELCDYNSVRKADLIRHMKSHSGEKPYSCELCEFKCIDTNKLVLHMRTHSGEKPYSCMLCEYKCTKKHSLDRHMQSHANVKPYSCKLCEYKCNYRSNLARHMRKHSGTTLYPSNHNHSN